MTKTTNYVKVGDRGLVVKNQIVSVQKSGLEIVVNIGMQDRTFTFPTAQLCDLAFKQLVIDLN